MRTPPLLISCLLLLLTSPYVPAQTYLVRTKEFPAEGKSVATTLSGSNRAFINLSTGGKVLKDDKKVEIEEKQYVEKVLQAGNDKPIKFSQTFTKAIKGNKEAPAEQSYAGKTIVFELKDGAYKVSAEGGGVTDKDLAMFAKNANKPKTGQAMYSDKPVKVGETWPISKKGLALVMDEAPPDAVDAKQIVATGKLLKAYQKNGQQWGVVEVIVTGPAKKFGPLQLSKPVEFQFKATLETAIDGSSSEGEMKGLMSFKGRSDFTQKELTFNLDIDIVSEYRQVQGAEK